MTGEDGALMYLSPELDRPFTSILRCCLIIGCTSLHSLSGGSASATLASLARLADTSRGFPSPCFPTANVLPITSNFSTLGSDDKYRRCLWKLGRASELPALSGEDVCTGDCDILRGESPLRVSTEDLGV